MKVITTNLLNRFWKNGVKPIKEAVTGKLDASKVVNSLLATEEGFALDATQGKVLKDQVDELNRNINHFSDVFHKIEKITAGTKVLTKTGTASASHIAFTNADIDNLLEVTNTSNANTVIFIMNGDGKANAVHFTTTYQSGNWYAVGESSWTGNLRVNYIIIRFI